MNVSINGVPETMLMPLFARAICTKKTPEVFSDPEALNIIEKLDYNFDNAEKDYAMNSGTIARSIVFDDLAKQYIAAHPDCNVVNIACGLDARFLRVDNGQLHWYDLDLPESIEVRKQLVPERDRVTMIACDATDPAWAEQIEAKEKPTLVIVEGLSMYLTADQNKAILKTIADNFPKAEVLYECVSDIWVHQEKVEKSISKTGSKFLWGIKTADDIAALEPRLKVVENANIIPGMEAQFGYYKFLGKLKLIKRITQRIGVLSTE